MGPFQELVGKEIEIRWRYWTKATDGKRQRKQGFIWCTGQVVEVWLTARRQRRRQRRRTRCRGVQCESGGRRTPSSQRVRHSSGRSSSLAIGMRRCPWAGATQPLSCSVHGRRRSSENCRVAALGARA